MIRIWLDDGTDFSLHGAADVMRLHNREWEFDETVRADEVRIGDMVMTSGHDWRRVVNTRIVD